METVGYSQAANSEGDDFADAEKGLRREKDRGLENGAAIQYVNDDDDDEVVKLNARESVQKGSLLPFMSLVASNLIDPSTYIVDLNTGAKAIHYAGHFGNLKALRVFIEIYRLEPSTMLDSYGLTVAHYAARSGDLAILRYLARVS